MNISNLLYFILSSDTTKVLVMVSFFLECLEFLAFAIYKMFLEVIYMIFKNRPSKEIKNSHILITGSAQGIGKLLATRLACDGNTLHLVDINTELNDENLEDFKSRDCKVFTYFCDVSKLDSILDLYTQVKANCAYVEYLFNNAGVMVGKLFPKTSLKEIDFVMKVNAMSGMYMTRVFMDDMIEHGGHLIFTGSVAGCIGAPFMTTYCTSKHAVTGFSRSLLYDLEYMGITQLKVTTVFPHFVDTGFSNAATVKLPALFPMLEPEWVADQIITATKEERNELILPRSTSGVLCLIYVWNCEVFRRFGKLLGNDLMKTFRVARRFNIESN